MYADDDVLDLGDQRQNDIAIAAEPSTSTPRQSPETSLEQVADLLGVRRSSPRKATKPARASGSAEKELLGGLFDPGQVGAPDTRANRISANRRQASTEHLRWIAQHGN